MYCSKCGTKVDDKANHCHNCGAKLIKPEVAESTEKITAAKIEETVKKTVEKTVEKTGMEDKKKLPMPAIAGVGAAVAIVLFLLIKMVMGSGGYEVMNYTSLALYGLNSETHAEPSFDREAFLTDFQKKKTLTEREKEEIYELLEDIEKDYALSEQSNLSNGDTVKITSNVRKDMLAAYGAKFKNGSKKIKIEGRVDITEVALDPYFVLTGNGINGIGTASLSVDLEKMIKDLSEIILKVDNSDEAKAFIDTQLQSVILSSYGANTMDCYNLSNGDEVEIPLVLHETEIPEYGIRFTLENDTYKGTVNDLLEFVEINLADYLAPQYYSDENYDGGASAYAGIDTEKLTEDLLAIFTEQNRGAYGKSYEGMDITYEAANAADEVRYSAGDGEFEMSKTEMLANGDEVTISWTAYDSDVNTQEIPSMGLRLIGGETTTEISGLLPPREIDLADAVTVTVSGNAPNLYAEFEVNRELDYVYMTELSRLPSKEAFTGRNGETITRELEYDKDELLKNGYVVTNNVISWTVETDVSMEITAESLEDEALLPIETENLNLLKEKAVDYASYALDEAGISGSILWEKADYHTEQIVTGNIQEGNQYEYRTFLVSHAALPVIDEKMEAAQADLYMVNCYYDVAQNLETKELIYDYYNEKMCYSSDAVETYMKDEMGFDEAQDSSIEDLITNETTGSVWGDASMFTMNLALEEEPEIAAESLPEIAGNDPVEEPVVTGEIEEKAASLAAVTIEYDNHIYARYDAEYSWELAERYCESAGGHLATVTSAAENAVIKKLLENAPYGRYWLGASDASFEGGWSWVTGESMTYRNWHSGQPDNATYDEETENYMAVGSDYSFEWNDLVSGKEETGFVLEVDPASVEEVASSYTICQPLSSIERFNNHNYETKLTDYVVDQDGTEHFGSIVLGTGSGENAEYNLNGEWSVLSMNLSTDADADTSAGMSIAIWGDDQLLYSNYDYGKKDTPVSFSIDVTGVQTLYIQTREKGRNNTNLYLNEAKLYATGNEEALTNSKVTLTDLTDVSNVSVSEEEMNRIHLYQFPGYLTENEDMGYENRKGVELVNGILSRDSMTFYAYRNAFATWDLGGAYTTFTGKILAGPETYEGSDAEHTYTVTVEILADGETVFQADQLSCAQGAVPFEVDLTGKNTLTIQTTVNSDQGNASCNLIDMTLTTAEKILMPKEKWHFPDTSSGPASFAADTVVCADRCYYRFDQAMSLLQAENFCKAAGGRLAMPKNEEQNNAITELVNGGIHNYYWLGGSLNGGFWIWNDAETFGAYQNWGYGQPDNRDGIENQLTMERYGEWNDYAPENLIGFVMEVQAS